MKIIDIEKYKKEWKNWDFKMWMSPTARDYYSIVVSRAHNNTKQLMAWVKEYSILKDGRPVTIAQKQMKVLPAAASLFADLQSKIGEEIHVGEWMKITQTRINEFAQVTDDHQWLHTDIERSKNESPFKTTIAHGFLTLSLVPKLTDSVTPNKITYPGAKMTVNYGLNKVRFPYPVKAGSTIRAHSRLIKVSPLKRGLQIEKEISVEIKNTRRPACVAESIERIYF